MGEQMLGVLGGMGVRATSPFLEMVLDEVQSAWAPESDFDYPPILILSWPAPMVIGKPLDHEAVSASVLQGCKRLQQAGATVLAMPCNTAHRYHESLQAALQVPLLNMVSLAAAELPDQSANVTLAGTKWTIDSGTYQQAIAKRGHHWVDPSPWQDAIDRAILSVKNGGDLTNAIADWRNLLDRIASAGADTVILACTDLNPLHKAPHSALNICDATAALARESVRSLERPVQ